MPHEGYADPITNDGPGFHSNVPVSELTERVARAIEASDVSSTRLVVETTDGVTHKARPTPRPHPALGSVLHRARPPTATDVWVGTRRLESMPTGGARAQPLASQKIPQAILLESPRGSGSTPTGCACAHPLAS